jgi:lia operon protein LiaG
MRMRERTRGIRGLAVAAVLVAVAAPVAPATAQTGSRHVLDGRDVAVYNLAGKVVVRGTKEAATVVVVSPGGPDAGRISIESGVIDGRPTLRTVFFDDRIIYPALGRGSSTFIQVREDGTFGSDRSRGRRVRVSGSGSGLEGWADLEVALAAGSSLRIFVGGGAITVTDVEGDLRLDTHNGPVTAQGVTGHLIIDTGSGAVDVTTVQGDVEVDTGSGAVTLNALRSGRIMVDTGSGRVTGGDLQADRLEVDTGSGRIGLSSVSAGVLRLDTGSGTVDLDLISNVRSLVIDTGSGGVVLSVPSVIDAELEIDVGSGGITVDIPIEYRKKSRSYVFGLLGSGEGRISIDTGSGSVRIVRRR